MRILVLVDGEHYPPVIRAAIAQLAQDLPGSTVVAAALLGGSEKLSGDGSLDLGVPVVGADSPDEAVAAGLSDHRPDLVHDLSDEPVLDDRTRLRLVSRALAAGVAYQGADFRFDPPPRPRVATKPTVAVIGTGKRTGKTAVTSHLARVLRERGAPPVVVAMGRGGPDSPVVVDPSEEDLSPQGLLALADSGRHAASDYMEDAVMAGVTTIGTRRCGGGMAGRPAFSNFVAGVEVANQRSEQLLVLEGSGHSMPPVHADATVLVTSSVTDRELLRGYMGPYRVLLSDLIVVTMDPTSLADSGACASLERDVRGLAQGVSTAAAIGEPPPIVPVRLVPTPLAPISGRRVVYVTTAPAAARDQLAAHLEAEHGAKVVGTSHHLADRPRLAADLERAGEAEVLVTELKAAAVDLAARYALERGMEVVFCDNRVAPVEGGPSFDEMGSAIADMAQQRFSL
ncbi:MAG TPA: hypothetical protein VHE80_01985 [Acidimicrobiales bacterium]|nr:hypothetical protein [Acidimicrobiales bacterium]